MVESEIARNPSPMTLDGIPAGKIKWNYTTGLELLAMMDAGEAYDRPDFFDYALRYYDSIVRPDGSVLTYKKSKYNLDHVCPGRALFALYDRTGDVRDASRLLLCLFYCRLLPLTSSFSHEPQLTEEQGDAQPVG